MASEHARDGVRGMATHRPRNWYRPENAGVILAEAGLTMTLPEAAACLGVTESTGYILVRDGKFPVPVMRLGHQWRIPTAEVRRVLGLPIEPTAAAS